MANLNKLYRCVGENYKDLNDYLEADEVTKREYYQKVDENDKAKDREIKKLKDKLHLLDGKHISDNKQYCPFQSLVDHDQQVRADERKKVIEEIRERLKKANFGIMSPTDLYSYTDNFLYQVEKGGK